jgi:hypothetical protein
MVKKSISIFIITELLVIASYLISFEFFMNLQIAFISSFAIIVGASFAYSKMVSNHVEADLVDEKRDLLDEIEDPYELYDDEPINNAPVEELDLKEIVKEERAKIKTLSIKSIKHGARGSVSLFRLLPYLFLVLGFIALKNNELLDIAIYLPSLLVGIIIGSVVSKGLVKQ